MKRKPVFVEYNRGNRIEYSLTDLFDFFADFQRIVGKRQTVLLLANNNIATCLHIFPVSYLKMSLSYLVSLLC